MDASALAQLSDGEFEGVLTANMHPPRRNAEAWAAIIHPDNIERAHRIIVNVHDRTAAVLRRRKTERDEFRVECFARGQEGKREWFATQAEADALRRRTATFHQRAQRAIAEISKAQRDVNRSQNHNVAGEYRETIRKLAVAVNAHQASHARAGSIAEQADYELWQLLDELSVPTGPANEPTKLRTMIDFYWRDVEPVSSEDAHRTQAERMMRSSPRPASFSSTPRARHTHNGKDLAS